MISIGIEDNFTTLISYSAEVASWYVKTTSHKCHLDVPPMLALLSIDKGFQPNKIWVYIVLLKTLKYEAHFIKMALIHASQLNAMATI